MLLLCVPISSMRHEISILLTHRMPFGLICLVFREETWAACWCCACVHRQRGTNLFLFCSILWTSYHVKSMWVTNVGVSFSVKWPFGALVSCCDICEETYVFNIARNEASFVLYTDNWIPFGFFLLHHMRGADNSNISYSRPPAVTVFWCFFEKELGPCPC